MGADWEQAPDLFPNAKEVRSRSARRDDRSRDTRASVDVADDEIQAGTRTSRLWPVDTQLGGIVAGDQRPRCGEPNNVLGHVVAKPAAR
jgi:hypothetical protein